MSVSTTITEALAEIKTIGKRIATKQGFVSKYLTRPDALKDPLEKDGGSRKSLDSALQSIADLEARIVIIRTEVQKANLSNTLTIGSRAMTIAEWLAWRKEVAEMRKLRISNLLTEILRARTAITISGRQTSDRYGSVQQTVQVGGEKQPDLIVNVDEGELSKELEDLENTLGTLDGRLSLFNATTTLSL